MDNNAQTDGGRGRSYDQAGIVADIQDWVKYTLPGFEFRKHQLETIYTIIDGILNKNRETTIVEAPTGSGKSLICLIAAGVLDHYYGMKSYILCSDLYLWKQYADYIDENMLPFGKLKGAKGNYTCELNEQDLSISMCKLKGVSWKVLMDNDAVDSTGFPCARTCEYVQQRKQAIRSHVTLMTYQLWLNYLNYTDGDVFGKRPVIFCDECHNIPGIIQMFCQPSISPKYNFPQMEEIIRYASEKHYSVEPQKYTTYEPVTGKREGLISVEDSYSVSGMHTDMETEFERIFGCEDKSEILDAYSKFYRIAEACGNIADVITENLAGKSKSKDLSKSDLKALKNAESVSSYRNQLLDFMRAVSMCGEDCLRYLVKNDVYDKDMTKSVTFACSKEDLLCNEYMLSNAPYKVMLSATVGSHDAFDDNIGVKYTKSKKSSMFRIPSTFDFSKSPIYYIPKYKMAKAVIAQNLPMVAQLIQSIVMSPRHGEEKGIIHTGSYKNAQALFELMPLEVRRRMYIYGSSKEKTSSMSDFEASSNGILVGPTLTEGIDLPDDGCRFIIIMKIPYPNLGDNLVVSKSQLFPKWYSSETSNVVIQAIGRGNRTPTDWCTTYILDGNFGKLFAETRDQYSPELQARIKTLNG